MKIVVAVAVAIALVSGAGRPAFARPLLTTYGGAKIVQQVAPGDPLIGMQLFVRAGLDRQTAAQSGLAALAAETILQTPVGVPALPLSEALAAHGGTLTYAMDGHAVRFYLEGMRGEFSSALLPLFTAALQRPGVTPATLNAARAALNRKIADDEKIPLAVGLRMLDSAFYTDSNAGMPQYGLPATLAGFTPADVRAFLNTYYRRGGAVVSADGGLDSAAQAGFTALLDALPAGTSSPVPFTGARMVKGQRRLVTHRDVSVPWLVAQFRAPSIGSPDFGAMLVLTSFLERTAAEVAENPTVTTRPFIDRAVGTLYNFDDRPANVILYVNGGFGDPSRPFNTALSIIQIFAHSKLAGDVGGMKAIAAGSYVDGMSSLEDRAWLAGVFAAQNLPPDYLERGLSAIRAVKPADLQRVARKYLDNPNVAIVLPRDEPAPN